MDSAFMLRIPCCISTYSRNLADLCDDSVIYSVKEHVGKNFYYCKVM